MNLTCAGCGTTGSIRWHRRCCTREFGDEDQHRQLKFPAAEEVSDEVHTLLAEVSLADGGVARPDHRHADADWSGTRGRRKPWRRAGFVPDRRGGRGCAAPERR